MIRVFVVGVPDSDQCHYLFTQNIARVKELGPKSCMLIMTDGAKYTFANNARDVVDIITGQVSMDDSDEEFLALPPATEVEQ